MPECVHTLQELETLCFEFYYTSPTRTVCATNLEKIAVFIIMAGPGPRCWQTGSAAIV